MGERLVRLRGNDDSQQSFSNEKRRAAMAHPAHAMGGFELSRVNRPGSLGGLDCYISAARVGRERTWGSQTTAPRSNSRMGRNIARARWHPARSQASQAQLPRL